MLANEFRPGALAPARSGRDPAAAKDLGDSHVGDPEAELEELALDPPVTPARVLPGKSEVELPKLRIASLQTWWPAAVSGPLSADELAMPAKQGLGAGEEGGAT